MESHLTQGGATTPETKVNGSSPSKASSSAHEAPTSNGYQTLEDKHEDTGSAPPEEDLMALLSSSGRVRVPSGRVVGSLVERFEHLASSSTTAQATKVKVVPTITHLRAPKENQHEIVREIASSSSKSSSQSRQSFVPPK